MTSVETRIFYARKWPIYLIAAVSFMPMLPLLMSGEKMNALIIVLLIELAINFILYSLFNSIRITIDDHGITYQAVFRKRFMAWKDIRETKLVLEIATKSRQNFWYFISTDHKQFRFNTGLFSKKTIQAVAETVIQQSPGAIVNDKLIAYSQGKFPWYAI